MLAATGMERTTSRETSIPLPIHTYPVYRPPLSRGFGSAIRDHAIGTYGAGVNLPGVVPDGRAIRCDYACLAYEFALSPTVGHAKWLVLKKCGRTGSDFGATLNGKRIKVSDTKRLEEARLGIGFSYRQPVAPHAATIKGLLDAHCEYSRLGSGALGLALTADGRLDGYWEAHINIWDVAAGLCIVKEAGGWTNDFLVNEGFTKGNPILATNPKLKYKLKGLLNLP